MASKEDKNVSPMMRQFFALKEQYPDVLLLIRCGDFYETFGDDALIASKVLGIILTKRASGGGEKMPLAGVPHHALQSYLPKLVRAGYKVAIVDQMEDPKLAKGLVKREITELLTPGVILEDNLLQAQENNFLAGVYRNEKNDECGVAFLDISTGDFSIAQGSFEYVETLLSSFKAREVVVFQQDKAWFRPRLQNYYLTYLDDWAFSYESSIIRLKKQFGVSSLKGYGVYTMPLALCCAGALLVYLEQTCHPSLAHINSISRIDSSEYMWMDKFTIANLEIFSGSKTLVEVMDTCTSPMGSRLLKTWLLMPSIDTSEISKRYDMVSYFVSEESRLDEVRNHIGEIGDMERILSKAAAGRIAPREILHLKRGLEHASSLSALVPEGSVALADCSSLVDFISTTISPESAAALGKGPVIAPGVSDELDSLRALSSDSRAALDAILQREIEATGIPSLKIDYNGVFGYYLEVRNMYRDRVPEEWIRKQTLVNAERYITPELKEFEQKILGAEGRILELETQIYATVVSELQKYVSRIKVNCQSVARLDVLAAFAYNAVRYDYCRPEVDSSDVIDIKAGRHPVIERFLPFGQEYVSNDIRLDNRKEQIIILTGPNMSGKSALLRQTALIVLMAQVGSFVPASAAHLGFCDKLFTRVGASDNIAQGESTFMVEMVETSMILHNLSPRSLVLLDEIGRGTSTYDGMSIARAIVEYIHESPKASKTLFATHYHELNDMENMYERVHNYHIAIKEDGQNIIFLRKLTRGGVEHSFGIHVARLAGMPAKVVSSAEKTLSRLERSERQQRNTPQQIKEGTLYSDGSLQLSMFQLDDPLLLDLKTSLEGADLNNMTPLQAFDLLREMKSKLGL